MALCLFSGVLFADTFTGVISDEKCGAKHAALSAADQACIQKCVDTGSDAVLVSGDKIYKITVQQAARTFAGKKVSVLGTLKGDTIDMQSVMKVQ
jgi:hypothetical protein